MTATHILRTRVTIETRDVVESIARQQQLTESAWLRRLIETTLQSTGAANSVRMSDAADRLPRQARLMIRLLPEDQMLLESRANARGMPAATYVSMAIRSHLRALAPLPKEERETLRRAIGELSVIGRNLNQIARAVNQGGRVTGPTRDELRALFRACEGLRDYVRRLYDANLRSWETGHAETPN